MTAVAKDYLKFPSREIYASALKGFFPRLICARIINTYRRFARKYGSKTEDILRDLRNKELDLKHLKELCTPYEGQNAKVENHPASDTKESITQKKKLRSRKKNYVHKNKGSPSNAYRRSTIKQIVRWRSSGKNRPTKVAKINFSTGVITIHRRGNQYSGGQNEF